MVGDARLRKFLFHGDSSLLCNLGKRATVFSNVAVSNRYWGAVYFEHSENGLVVLQTLGFAGFGLLTAPGGFTHVCFVNGTSYYVLSWSALSRPASEIL